MPLSAIDIGFLASHGFFRIYPQYRDRFLTIARGVYQRMKKGSGIAPLPDDCEILLETVLIASTVFADAVMDVCKSINFPNPKDPCWPDFFAGAVARYVTNYEWQDIAI
jgi:hypothetical protein